VGRLTEYLNTDINHNRTIDMNGLRYFKAVVFVACFSAIAPATLTAQDPAASETAKLVAVLNSADASIFDKAKACQRLALVGDESAVPALAGLLTDEKLSAYAREALEGIPAAACDAALREALTRLEGERLIGVLGSIGARRDVEAIDAVGEMLSSDDAATAAAAARALGHIGTPATADILLKTLSDATPESGPALGKACLICALKLTKQNETDKAVALCDALRNAQVPQHVKLAATRNAIAALGEDGLSRLAELLASEDESQFRIALHVARQLGDDVDASSVLVAGLKGQSTARQALTLIALGDLGDAASLPTVLEVATGGEGEARIEAILALAQLGDATAVPVLLAAATQSDDRIAGAAKSTLAVLDAGDINAAIVEMLVSTDTATCQMAIDMTAQRRIASAAPALLKLTQGNNATLRTSAIKALGSTARLEDLTDFIALAIASQQSDDAATVAAALKSACVRMPQEACARKLAAAMPSASTATRIFLLDQLASVGGPTALKMVVSAAKSNDDAAQDAGTRLLGKWLTADAAPAMLDLAKTLPEGKYQIRALRGYVRIARQLNMTPEERITVCRNTLAIAERSDDRALVFEVIRRYPTGDGLTLAASLLDEADLKQQACATIVEIADRVAMSAPEATEKALTQVLETATDAAVNASAEKSLVIAREGVRLKKEEAQFTSVFDGKTLNGWTQPGKVYRVEEGAIVGGSLEKAIGGGNDYIALDGEHGDFELRLEARIKGPGSPNGGIYLRSSRTAGVGYQADLGSAYYGCLYDEVRRNRMLAYANPKQEIETGQWIGYRIRCEGPRIRIWINGTQTVDYTEKEPGIATTGAIGFQSHANHASETWYRNIRVRRLDENKLEVKSVVEPKPQPTPTPDEGEFTSLFDGKTFAGWQGDMEFWRIENGAITGGTLTEKVACNQYLQTTKEYGDFELRLEFKLVGVEATNGGVDIRAAQMPNSHEMIGYQADLGNGWWGCLYEHGRGRNLLAGPEEDQRAKPVRLNEWNDYRIRCEGNRVQFWINEIRTVDYTEQDPDIPRKGIIALQVHDNLAMEAWYRNLRIKEL
jgi:HEAT repeat protein